MRWTVDLASPEDTQAAAEALGRELEPGDCLGFTGDLGAGKTTFVQGLARGLEVPTSVRITSPTFTLIHEIDGGRVPLVHADLYRIEDVRELDHLGLHDMVEGRAVVAIEWAELHPVLPADHLRIELRVTGPTNRRLSAWATGGRSAAILEAWSRRFDGG